MNTAYRLSLLLLASFCFAFTAQAQYRGLQQPFHVLIPTAETNNGLPPGDLNGPSPSISRPYKSSIDRFRISGQGRRLPDPNNPRLSPEDQDFKGQFSWFFNDKPYIAEALAYPDGQAYYIVRHTVKGTDACGFGEDLPIALTKKGYTVQILGKLDYSLPYAVKLIGKVVQLKTITETTYIQKFYHVVGGLMLRRILPKLNKQPMQNLDQTEMEVGEGLTYKPDKELLWRDESSKIIKPDKSFRDLTPKKVRTMKK